MITIVVTGYCLLYLLNSNVEIPIIIQFLGVIEALIVGMITTLFSWDNTQMVIENNENKYFRSIDRHYILGSKNSVELQ